MANLTPKTATSAQHRILVFGDSIAYGAWDEQGGWADVLKRTLHQKNRKSDDSVLCQVHNLGIDGETTDGLYARIEQEIIARKTMDWPLSIIIGVGLQDVRTIAATGTRTINQDHFLENIRLIIGLAKKYADMDEDGSSRVILLSITPVQYPRTTFKKFTYSNEDVRRFNALLAQVSRDLAIPLCTLEKFEAAAALPKSDVYNADGIHPNSKGHELILADVLRTIAAQWQL